MSPGVICSIKTSLSLLPSPHCPQPGDSGGLLWCIRMLWKFEPPFLLLAGYIRDETGSYCGALLLCGVMMLLGGLAFLSKPLAHGLQERREKQKKHPRTWSSTTRNRYSGHPGLWRWKKPPAARIKMTGLYHVHTPSLDLVPWVHFVHPWSVGKSTEKDHFAQ